MSETAPPPEGAAIAAFKEQLGIHQTEEPHFGWIAEVGLKSPLPPRYTSHEDQESGFIYYIDHDRQSSSWENPLVPYLRRIVEIGRSYLREPTDSFFDDQRGRLWHQHKHGLDCWQGPFMDENGKQYFVNPAEEISTWQDPRVDAQYIFELESGLLASLEEVLPGLGQRPEDTPWRTQGGAEVLTIEGGSSTARLTSSWRRTGTNFMGTPSAASLKDLAKQSAKVEAESTFEQMSGAAKRLQGLQEDEEEAQRLAFARKIEERRKRRGQNDTGGQVSGRPLRPPPPPNLASVQESAAAPSEARRRPAPLLESQDSSSGADGTREVFKPPSVPPSPLAGTVPKSPFAETGAWKSRNGAHQGTAFADFELTSSRPGQADCVTQQTGP